MSSPIRLDPFGGVTSLREAMDQLMGQAVLRPGFGAFASGAFGQMNVIEVDGKYLVQAALPGISAEDAELTVRQNTLTLKVKITEPLDQEQLKGATYLLHEFGAGEFSRTISFPKDVDADAVRADYDRGILTVEIPVAAHAQPRRIQIHSADSQQTAQIVEQNMPAGLQATQ
ncbi:MAG TPA: Hsp20/alpha crystallin family protein [Ktedonobacterales bacterium]|jgi:HSP20 family protein|nr:Hsp20/alpha crystallin family protein [Ktedonobacterales bacterium]